MPAQTLREHVLHQLTKRQAHATFDDAVAHWPPAARGVRPTGLPHSGWELVEHLRIAQRDILDFCQADAYEQPAWPDDYWPAAAAPPSENAWHDSLQQIRDDHAALCTLVRDTPDLMAVVPHGETQTFLREALLVADHNAYHLGQLVDVRRALDCWPPEADDAA